jgi:hypothetical protein
VEDLATLLFEKLESLLSKIIQSNRLSIRISISGCATFLMQATYLVACALAVFQLSE